MSFSSPRVLWTAEKAHFFSLLSSLTFRPLYHLDSSGTCLPWNLSQCTVCVSFSAFWCRSLGGWTSGTCSFAVWKECENSGCSEKEKSSLSTKRLRGFPLAFLSIVSSLFPACTKSSRLLCLFNWLDFQVCPQLYGIMTSFRLGIITTWICFMSLQ